MSYDPDKHSGRLKRLDPSFYQGPTWVHWTIAIEDRKTGWLSETLHQEIRELLLHTSSRQSTICPVYCLMPDHAHFLIGGLSRASDQRGAMRFFHAQLNRILKPEFSLQSQAYDHVLSSKERERSEFETIAGYILENPVRGSLMEHYADWSYSGCVVPGYPDLHPTDSDFWNRFWKIYYRLLDE